jgi:hypothetical protein
LSAWNRFPARQLRDGETLALVALDQRVGSVREQAGEALGLRVALSTSHSATMRTPGTFPNISMWWLPLPLKPTMAIRIPSFNPEIGSTSRDFAAYGNHRSN